MRTKSNKSELSFFKPSWKYSQISPPPSRRKLRHHRDKERNVRRMHKVNSQRFVKESYRRSPRSCITYASNDRKTFMTRIDKYDLFCHPTNVENCIDECTRDEKWHWTRIVEGYVIEIFFWFIKKQQETRDCTRERHEIRVKPVDFPLYLGRCHELSIGLFPYFASQCRVARREGRRVISTTRGKYNAL